MLQSCVVFSYLMLRGKAVRYCSLLAFTVHYCWPEPCVYGVYTVFLAGKLLYIGLARTVYILRIWPYIWWFPCQNTVYTLYIYGSGQPYVCTVFLAGILLYIWSHAEHIYGPGKTYCPSFFALALFSMSHPIISEQQWSVKVPQTHRSCLIEIQFSILPPILCYDLVLIKKTQAQCPEIRESSNLWLFLTLKLLYISLQLLFSSCSWSGRLEEGL